ncbi:MAG: Fe-S cluster assembly protein SufB, partial [Candidatus Hydrogenedens sp.]|nr:Fe-S cluster assembly protein SufB [Candidatus Hydrogenedens sp.]
KQATSWEDLPDDIKSTYDRLGIPEAEKQRLVAGVAAQYESEVVYHQIREDLEEKGVIFVDTDTALKEHEEIFREYFGTVIPVGDNKFASLNTAVWSGGSFIYVPPGVKVPMPLQAYFRINQENMGQFERTLIIADEGAEVRYLEGCTAPMRDENQLHAAVVELIAHKDASIRYATVQNWYAGDEEGRGGIYNFVTKRGKCEGENAHISWTQVETGSAITWKYPSCLLMGDNSVGEFYSVALTKGRQQADTGTKMIHLGRNTRSTVISKTISAGRSDNSYRGLVRVMPKAANARNYTQCDSLLMGNRCGAHTFPYIDVRNASASVEHEASTSKISEDQLFYCQSRGISPEDAISMVVNGFCKEVFDHLPMEFAVEASRLLAVSLEGSVG